MPSPFPGMDPYLEESEWMSVHADLCSAIVRQLAPKVRPKYMVRTIRRFVTEMEDAVSITRKDVYPDVTVAETKEAYRTAGKSLIITPAPLKLETVMPEQVPVVSVEIRDVAGRDLVTAIEVLSPVNKRGEGYKEYLAKRQRILFSMAHLLEIDLLRAGRRVPMLQPLPDAPYFVFLSRAKKRPLTEVWPIQLSERLPVVPVPLLDGDPDIPLDLQQALDTIYDETGYDLAIEYSKPLEVPLEGESAGWAAERLRAAGFSTGGKRAKRDILSVTRTKR
jgi:hypothetical protein